MPQARLWRTERHAPAPRAAPALVDALADDLQYGAPPWAAFDTSYERSSGRHQRVGTLVRPGAPPGSRRAAHRVAALRCVKELLHTFS
jgi:hypothetical protein